MNIYDLSRTGLIRLIQEHDSRNNNSVRNFLEENNNKFASIDPIEVLHQKNHEVYNNLIDSIRAYNDNYVDVNSVDGPHYKAIQIASQEFTGELIDIIMGYNCDDDDEEELEEEPLTEEELRKLGLLST